MAKRDIMAITIKAAPTAQLIDVIEIQCKTVAEEGGIYVENIKHYFVNYADLGPVPKQHVKDVALDAQKFLAQIEPITDTDELAITSDALLRGTSVTSVGTNAVLTP
jgi:hypothetical protein